MDISILGETYTYRSLTRKEYKEILAENLDDPVGFEDEIAKLCTLKIPDDFPGWEDCYAGIPSTLAEAILDASGMLNEDSVRKLIKAVEDWASTDEARIDCLICFCFPTMTPDILESMESLTWYKYAAMAKMIMGGIHGVDPSVFLEGTPPAQVLPQQQPPGMHGNAYGVNRQPSRLESEGNFTFIK